jgi:Uncharacterised nucleotidyltransferase
MQPELSAEILLLFDSVRSALQLSSADEFSTRLKPTVDWPKFWKLAHAQGLSGPVLSAFTAANIPIPDDLKSARSASAMRALFLTGQLIEILRLLDSQGIPALAFKGPVLSNDAWADPAMRAAGDLDLLLHPSDIPAARTLLLAHGFEPIFPTSTAAEAKYLSSLAGKPLNKYVRSHSEHHLLRPSDRLNIDLHSSIALRQFALQLDCENLWKNSRTITLAGSSIPTLGLEDLLLVLCINAAKDCWMRLDRICDIAALIVRHPRIDFDILIDQSRRAGALRITLVTLLLARDLLRLPLPASMNHQIDQDPAAIDLAIEIIRHISRGPHPRTHWAEFQLQLRARDQLRGKLRYMLCQCYPTVGDWSALPLPPMLSFLHILFRPLRLLLQPDRKSP